MDIYSASSLKQQSADRHVAPLGHIILIPSQSVFLLTAACLAEKQDIPIIVFGLTRSGLEPTIYSTWGEHADHYTTDAVNVDDKTWTFRLLFICLYSVFH